MELSEIIPHIEALIFASDRPLTSLDLVDLINNAFGFMEQQITLDQVETSLEGIREKYNSDFYPFEVFQSGGGWQFLSKPAFHTTIAQLNGGKFLKKLSNAALETLSIIAYKQPITKGEIESIRGVNSDYSVQKLLEKELIIISGRSEDLPGKPLIYETSKSFMDYFGLNSATDLPKIKEVFAEQFEPTSQQRSIEENMDFGIFSKLEENKHQTEAGREQGTEQDDASNNVILIGNSDNDMNDQSILEMELADSEIREGLQDATEALNQELHPDLNAIETELSPESISDTTEQNEHTDDLENQEEELAALEQSEANQDADAEDQIDNDNDFGEEEEEEEDDDDDDGKEQPHSSN